MVWCRWFKLTEVLKMRHFDGCLTLSDCWCEVKRYGEVLGVGTMILIGEVVGGLASGSLALLADAGHVGVDVGAVCVSIFVAYLVKMKRPEEKVRAIGGYINAFLLALVAVGIILEAKDRIEEPRDITNWIMISIAFLGMIGNLVQRNILREGKDESVTHYLLALHVDTDLWQSVGVIVAACIIWVTGFSRIDSLISIFIGIVMMYFVLKFFAEGTGHHCHHDHGGGHSH